MTKYETSTKDYLFAILISGTEEKKNGSLRELCNRYKEINFYTIKKLAEQHTKWWIKGGIGMRKVEFNAGIYEKNGGIDMMREEDFTQGEYVKKEDVMTYLKVFNWNMQEKN